MADPTDNKNSAASTPTVPPQEILDAAKRAAIEHGKRGRALTHFMYGSKGKIGLYTVEGVLVGEFAKTDEAWDKVRELKAGDCPQIKCWKVSNAEAILKKLPKAVAPATA